MEKQIGLTSTELGEIFAQIKTTGDNSLGDKIYNAYLPIIGNYAKIYGLNQDQVQDIYSEVISFVYDKVLEGVIKPSEFNICLTNTMKRQCSDFINQKSSNQAKFQSSMLGMSYAKNCSTEQQAKREEKQNFATQSLMFTVQFLNNLEHNPELAESYGLDYTKIEMLKDFYGINADKVRLGYKQIADKYNVSEKRAVAMLGNALKSVRNIEEFQPIINHLHS